MIRKTLWLLLFFLLCKTMVYAQLSMGNPREKFSMTASIDGVANSSYTWDTDNNQDVADGRMTRQMNVKLRSSIKLVSGLMGSVSIQPFYNYNTTRLNTDWREGTALFDFPQEHHHFGATLSASMNLMLGSREKGKPITLIITSTPNFSENGFEQWSAIGGVIVHVTRSEKTYLGLGGGILIGTAIRWPLWPLFIYRHQFDRRWSINGMAANWMLSYQTSPQFRLSGGMELVSDKIYFRPKDERLPHKASFDLISERIGLFANWQTTKELSMELSTGVNYPFYGRIRAVNDSHIYMKLKADPKPFVQLKLNYSLSKENHQVRK